MTLSNRSSRPWDEMLADVSRKTRSLFDGEVIVYDERDPEFPDDHYVVIAVTSTKPVDQIVAAEWEWIREIRATTPQGWKCLRLSIRPT